MEGEGSRLNTTLSIRLQFGYTEGGEILFFGTPFTLKLQKFKLIRATFIGEHSAILFLRIVETHNINCTNSILHVYVHA